MFVGAARRSVVDGLIAQFDEVRRDCTPRMVTLVAPPGWGKTRIVQEFYARLAADQPEPRYWPVSLVDDPDAATATFVDVTTSRKVVRHRRMATPADAVPSWLWLAPPASRLGDGSCGPALDFLVSQLIPHLGPILRQIDDGGQLDAELTEAVVAAVSLRHLVELTRIGPELTNRLVRLSLDRATPGSMGSGSMGSGSGEQGGVEPSRVANAYVTLLRLLAERAPVGTVIVLDDAHDLDLATVTFVTEALSAGLPILFVATTWPNPPVDDVTPSPFTEYLTDSEDADRVRRTVLAHLDPGELVDYLRAQFPGTDPQVAYRLAERADGNPYVLRLLLDTPRVRLATENGRIALDADEIDSLHGGLDSLLREHWARLTTGVQQTLATAAMLGQSFVDDVLLAALEAVDAETGSGLADALASSWIRPTGEPARVIEFIERIRYELARDAVTNVLSPQVREMVMRAALRTVHRLLDSSDTEHRQTLLALHVGLAQDGAETDLVRAAASARELADTARLQHRRPDAIRYLNRALEWLEKADHVEPVLLVGYLTALAQSQQVETSRADSEQAAVRAWNLASEHLPPGDEARLHAQLAVFRARLQRERPESYAEAVALLRDVEANMPPDASPLLTRDLWSGQRNLLSLEGEHAAARERSRELVALCEAKLGSHNRWTLDALEEVAFQSVRVDDFAEAIRVRRDVLRRRIDNIPTTGRLPTALARHNLASVLARAGESHLDEAAELAQAALDIWSRAYGMTGVRPRRARLVRARVWQLQGLAAEGHGDDDRALELFGKAAAETAAILELRADAGAGSRAHAMMRHGWSLAALRDRTCLRMLTESLRLRAENLRQDHTFWAVRECASVLVWAYRRFGLELEAQSVMRRYQLDAATG